MKRKWIALVLVLAMIVSLGAVSAAAGKNSTKKVAAKTTVAADTENAALVASVTIQPDAVGTLSFENLEKRMRENCLDILIMQTSIDSLEEVDYEDAKDDLRQMLNGVAAGQWQLACVNMSTSGSYAQLQSQYNALSEQYELLRSGELQKENAGLIRQLRAGQDQVVQMGESLYITLVELETQEGALQRQLEALNRTVEEMELRYKMGQISALQLTEIKNGRSSLISGMETLQMNIRNLKTQMELLLGAELTGEIRLLGVPEVTEKQLSAMDPEQDLLRAKAKSYTLYAAGETLEEAEETYTTDARTYGYNEELVGYRTARRTWEAAQYTYNNAVQTFEMSFRQLYEQVQDCSQLLAAAKTALEGEKLACRAAELKYQQGTLSQNAYLTAKDELEAAEETVQTASCDLFAAYNNYCWAVEHGILN